MTKKQSKQQMGYWLDKSVDPPEVRSVMCTVRANGIWNVPDDCPKPRNDVIFSAPEAAVAAVLPLRMHTRESLIGLMNELYQDERKVRDILRRFREREGTAGPFGDIVPFTILTTSRRITLGGKEYSLGTVLDVIEGLEETDGFFDRILINDPHLAEFLEGKQVAERHNKGSYYKGPKYDEFRKAVFEAAGIKE